MDAPLRSFRVPRWLVWTLAVPAMIAAALAVLAWQRGDVWKARALEAINRELAGELEVNEMTLSWWNGFPDVSVELAHVALLSPEQDTLVLADRVGLELGFWTLWGDAPELTSVALEGGRVHLAQDAAGRWNVMDLLASPDNRDAEGPALTVGRLSWTDVDVSWAVEGAASGSLRLQRATLELPSESAPLRWEAHAKNVTVAHRDLPNLRPVEAACIGSWMPQGEDGWTCAGEVSVHGMEASWNAESSPSKGWVARVQVPKITQRAIDAVWVDPPWKGTVELDHAVSLDVRLQPQSTEVHWSAGKEAFQLAPQLTGLTMAVQGVCSGEGTFKQEFGAWSWAVDEALLSGNGWSLEGSVKPTSSSRLQIDGRATLDAATPFQSWIPEVPMDVLSVLPVSGTATAQGSVSWDLQRGMQSMLGTVALSQITGKLDGQPYLLEAPEIRMESTSCSGEDLVFQWAGTNADFDIKNLSWPQLLGSGPVTGDVHVRARSIHVNPILTWWEHLNRPATTEAVLLPPGSSLGLHVDSDVLEWDALQCTKLVARTKVSHNRWSIQSAQIQGLEGRTHVEGSLGPGRAGWFLTLRGSADDVSLPKLFSTYSNFGQTLIRHDHLSGAMSTAGTLGMSWDLDGNWHGEEFTASLQTGINYGRLRGLEVFEEVADYLEGHRLMAPLVDPDDLRERLKDVAFEPVSQRIDVRAEEVKLPMTVIQSSAMNVAIEGVYDFDSNIDYTLGFALRDLRASATDAFGVMEDDGLGNQFFLRMSGPVEEPVYAYDREAAKDHRREAIQAEKQRLRDALKQRNAPATPPQPDRTPPPSSGSSQSHEEEGKSSLLDRVRKPKDKKDKDLFNPDDDDYL